MQLKTLDLYDRNHGKQFPALGDHGKPETGD